MDAKTLDELEARWKRMAQGEPEHEAHIGLQLIVALRETRRELEKERARRFNLEVRVNGAGWGIR